MALPQRKQSPNIKRNEEENVTKNRTKFAILVVLGMLALIVTVQPVFACTGGCTPGFWKQEQHFDFWMEPYAPDSPLSDVFAVPSDLYDPGDDRWSADDTLLQALSYHGGRGRAGAARILLRAAVATLLNSAYDESQAWQWDYHWHWTAEDLTGYSTPC